MNIPTPIVDQIVQSLAAALWNRPELTFLREPIETALKGKEFQALLQTALEKTAHETNLLPFIDEAFLKESPVQMALARYILDGETAEVDDLARRYGQYIGQNKAQFEANLKHYLKRVRDTFVSHPAYSGLILARGQDQMLAAIEVFKREIHDRLGILQAENAQDHAELIQQNRQILERLEKILEIPEIQQVLEARKGVHLFLSYSRKDANLVKTIRLTLEQAGHKVWQDTTAIKGGREWIKSIAEGIKASYAVVTVVSQAAQDSEWVQIEYLEARRRNKEVIPLKIDASEIPIEMLALNVIHAHPNFDTGIQQLLDSLAKPEISQAKADLQQAQAQAPSRRQHEIDYLERLQLEQNVGQIYTPMAGQAILQAESPHTEIQRAPASISPLFQEFDEMIEAEFGHKPHFQTRTVDDVTQAVATGKQLVILGDPGAGKTTTLWKLAGDYIQQALVDEKAPLPVILNLGGLEPTVSVAEALQKRLDPLSLDELLGNKRLILLFDALNELPASQRASKIEEIQGLVKAAQQTHSIAVVTCRALDYQGELDLGIDQKVQVTPLDPERIWAFCRKHLPTHGNALFWDLAGGDIVRQTWETWQRAGASFTLFWTADDIPRKNPNIYNSTSGQEDQAWREQVKNPRSMMRLARNPYMLFMITGVYARTNGALPKNRGRLFELFVNYLLQKREQLQAESEPLKVALSNLAYQMQVEEMGTVTNEQMARYYLTDSQLYYAKSANLLDGSGELRFTHQLLQEYFAAKRLDREMQNHTPASQFFPPEKWWQPTGWEETAILLAGLYSDDCTDVLEWLKEAQPELSARCVLESGASTPDDAYEKLKLRDLWLPRLTNLKTDAAPEARAAVGRAIGSLDYQIITQKRASPLLDDREWVGVKDGLPDIDWVEIPAGKFLYGSDKDKDPQAYADETPQRELDLPVYWMSRYPITFAQFQTFIDDPQGFGNPEWWEGLANEQYRHQNQQAPGDQAFKYTNHPRERVSWYDAIAFCRWFSHRLWSVGAHSHAPLQVDYDPMNPFTWLVRLPTEQEWEKAARGTDGRIYPYGNEFDATKGNTFETRIGQTSAVGIFPEGASPYGLQDMSGNVWEWCLTEDESKQDDNLTNSNSRVIRGGSWNDDQNNARAVDRNYNPPNNRNVMLGFRVVCGFRPS